MNLAIFDFRFAICDLAKDVGPAIEWKIDTQARDAEIRQPAA